MDDESFIGAFGDVPTDLAGDYSQLYIFRAEDFGAWYRRVRDAHEREVDGGVDAMTDAELAEHGLVRLPVDADGELIRVGDVMDSRVDYLFDGKPFTVRALVLCEDGWEAADGRFGNRYEPDSLHHHHEPTVEEVMQEMLEQAVGYSDAHTTVALNAIAEYSAKLRLAEGVE